jgi:hypothetical protein
MSPKEGLAFVRRYGVVLQAARGPVPTLAEAVVGGPIRGSWSSHPKGHEIFSVADSISENDEVLVCKLVEGKVTYVHRRLWPALVRLASRFQKGRLAKIWNEHTRTGAHRSRVIAFPEWVPSDVLREARRLSTIEAEQVLAPWMALGWDGHCWTVRVQLPSWNEFRNRRDAVVSRRSSGSAEGTVALVFAPEGRDDAPMRDAEVELARWPLRHEREMQSALLARLVEDYDELIGDPEDVLEDDEPPPSVSKPEDFKSLITLRRIYVHQVKKDGCPYVGFEFTCCWDDEHGLGVLMHDARIVEIGGGHTASLLWIARRDAEAV